VASADDLVAAAAAAAAAVAVVVTGADIVAPVAANVCLILFLHLFL